MPPLPPISGMIRIALIGSLANDADVVNRFYNYYISSTAPPTNLNALSAAIAGRWNTDLAAQFPTDYTLTEVICEDLSSSTAPVGNNVTSHAGTRSGARLSASACALLRFHIPRRYRGGHPRMYLSAGTQPDMTDAQTWNPTFLSGLVTAWTTFIGHVNTDVLTSYPGSSPSHANVSYYNGFRNVTYPSGRIYPRPVLRTVPVVDFVSTYDANPKVASQRRRNLTP